MSALSQKRLILALSQKSGSFGKSCIDNKELNNMLSQKCLAFSTFETKPEKSIKLSKRVT